MPKQERGIATREAILQAGARVFGRMHYERARVADILAEAGITQGGFYFHFPGGKKQVAEELILRQDAAFAELRDAAAAEGEGISALVAIGRALGRHLQADAVARAGVRLVTQAPEEFPGVAQLVNPSWLQALESTLERARADGSLHRGVDIPRAARSLVYLFNGTHASSYVSDGWEALPDAVETAIEFAVQALAAPDASRCAQGSGDPDARR
ncbi:TetR/AcrR family transcriptional regulator [Microbacterium marinilacus]|uniref:ScbR family autoregulator-binding transcription factor n=1 Tax=Microbacterium marinilacus TaxID=415209 RepID=A0ABP7B120_9MICO|nr:TetR/AcrR family transcriptional regulator [Microbacterium marinilacus]MBY0688686.1 TetR/AcrR family transcriptional regulator [Microbacterium marinilacus]